MTSRPNVVLATVTGLVIVLAVVAGLLTLRREPPQLDVSTPDGTVQTFVLAFIDGDDETAVAFLDPSLGCKAPLRDVYRPTRVSLTVASTKTTEPKATVVLDVTEYGGGPFDSWSHREVYDLVRRDSGWMITGNPWPVYSCK